MISLHRRLAALSLSCAITALVPHAFGQQSATAPKRTLVRAGHLLDVKTGKDRRCADASSSSATRSSRIAPTVSILCSPATTCRPWKSDRDAGPDRRAYAPDHEYQLRSLSRADSDRRQRSHQSASPMRAPRCWRASPPCAMWARAATPMSTCATPSTRARCRGRICW